MSELKMHYSAEGMINGLVRGMLRLASIPYNALKDSPDNQDTVSKAYLHDRFETVMSDSPMGYLYTVSEMFRNLGIMERRRKKGDTTAVDEFFEIYQGFPEEASFEKIEQSIDINHDKIEKLLEKNGEDQ